MFLIGTENVMYFSVFFSQALKLVFKFFSQLFDFKVLVTTRTIMEHQRRFFWCFVSSITGTMGSPPIFSCVMTLIPDPKIFFFLMKHICIYDRVFVFCIIFLLSSSEVSFLFFLPLIISVLF